MNTLRQSKRESEIFHPDARIRENERVYTTYIAIPYIPADTLEKMEFYLHMQTNALKAGEWIAETNSWMERKSRMLESNPNNIICRQISAIRKRIEQYKDKEEICRNFAEELVAQFEQDQLEAEDRHREYVEACAAKNISVPTQKEKIDARIERITKMNQCTDEIKTTNNKEAQKEIKIRFYGSPEAHRKEYNQIKIWENRSKK